MTKHHKAKDIMSAKGKICLLPSVITTASLFSGFYAYSFSDQRPVFSCRRGNYCFRNL